VAGQTIADWENAKNEPNEGDVEALARYFGMTQAELRYGIPQSNPQGGQLLEVLLSANKTIEELRTQLAQRPAAGGAIYDPEFKRLMGDAMTRLMGVRGITTPAALAQALSEAGNETTADEVRRILEGYVPSPRKIIAIAQVAGYDPGHLLFGAASRAPKFREWPAGPPEQRDAVSHFGPLPSQSRMETKKPRRKSG